MSKKKNKEQLPNKLPHKEYLETLPKKRMAAGLIIRDPQNRILMLAPSYKSIMEIPGGVVEKDESPYEACKREVHEELGKFSFHINKKVITSLSINVFFKWAMGDFRPVCRRTFFNYTDAN